VPLLRAAHVCHCIYFIHFVANLHNPGTEIKFIAVLGLSGKNEIVQKSNMEKKAGFYELEEIYYVIFFPDKKMLNITSLKSIRSK